MTKQQKISTGDGEDVIAQPEGTPKAGAAHSATDAKQARAGASSPAPGDRELKEAEPADEAEAQAADPEIARVQRHLGPANPAALKTELGTDADSPINKAGVPVVPTRAQKKAGGNYVVDPTGANGELHRNGTVYRAGDTLQLTDAEAATLGPIVQKIR